MQSVKRVHWDKSQPAKCEHFTAVFTFFFVFVFFNISLIVSVNVTCLINVDLFNYGPYLTKKIVKMWRHEIQLRMERIFLLSFGSVL